MDEPTLERLRGEGWFVYRFLDGAVRFMCSWLRRPRWSRTSARRWGGWRVPGPSLAAPRPAAWRSRPPGPGG
ncbi:hypothetical protein ACRAWD_01445 [Caulobacter segnis]